jgi:hypothetical protein
MSDPIHGLRLDFSGGVATAVLVCPASGGCEPPGYCSECGRIRGDTTTKRCDRCTADDATFCNAKEWCDAGDVLDWIEGEVTVSVEIEWDSDEGPTLTFTGPGA